MKLFAKGKGGPSAPSAAPSAFQPIDRTGLLSLLDQVVNSGQSGLLELQEPRGAWAYAFQGGALTHASGGRVRGARQAFDLLWEFQQGQYRYVGGTAHGLSSNLYIDKGRLLEMLRRSQAALQGPASPYIPADQQRAVPQYPTAPGGQPWGQQAPAPGQGWAPPAYPAAPPGYPQPAAPMAGYPPAGAPQAPPGYPQPFPPQSYPAPPQGYPAQPQPGAPPFAPAGPYPTGQPVPGYPGAYAPPGPPQAAPMAPPQQARPYPQAPAPMPQAAQPPAPRVMGPRPAPTGRPTTPPSFSVPPMMIPRKAPAYQPPAAPVPVPAPAPPEPPKSVPVDDLKALRASLVAQAPPAGPKPTANWNVRGADGTVAPAPAPKAASGAKGGGKKQSRLRGAVELQLIKFLLWACERRYSVDDHWTLKDAFEVSTMELRDQFVGAFSQSFKATPKAGIAEDEVDELAAGRMRGRAKSRKR